MKRLSIIFLGFIGLIFSQCTEEVKIVEFTIPQVERLLSADDEKSWLRTAYLIDGQAVFAGDCELQTITSFYRDENDTARYVVRSNPAVCPGTGDTLETGYWEIIGRQGNIDVAESIELIHDADTAIRYIDQVTSLYLILSGLENEVPVEISYEAIPPE